MASHLHNQRILKFLLFLSALVLTIFVYASYTTISPSYAPAPPQEPAPNTEFLRSNNRSQQNRANFEDDNDDAAKSSAAGIGIRAAPNDDLNEVAAAHIKFNKKATHASGGKIKVGDVKRKQQKHHRKPTIDEVANADSGGGNTVGGNDNNVASEDLNNEDRFANNDVLTEEQYIQNIENTFGNINNSNAVAAAAQPQEQFAQQQQQKEQNSNDQTPNQLPSNSNNNNNNNNNNLNKILDSDVLIPTSNLQKFIENADKILKNMTVNNLNPSDAAAGAPQNNIDLREKVIDAQSPLVPSIQIDMGNSLDNNQLDNNIENNDEALPPSVVMKIKQPSEQIDQVKEEKEEKQEMVKAVPKAAPKKTKKIIKEIPKAKILNSTTSISPYDPSKCIQTEQIYESGHLNEEINIDKICPNTGEDLKLLILITSAPSHDEARLAIRQTWGHYGTRRDVSIAFMLGRTDNETINIALTEENYLYGDLIRGNFIDSYNNLTLKTVSSLEWVDQHCSSAKYLLKTDDDMFINVPKLLDFLENHSKEKHVIFGRLAKKWKPIRNIKSKYYVSVDQFAASIFPPFTTGPAYVLSRDTIHELYVRALNQVYLKLEDVFTTGVVAQQLGIKRIHVNEFLNRRVSFNPCNIRKTISVHMIKANEQFDLWKKLLDQTTKCK